MLPVSSLSCTYAYSYFHFACILHYKSIHIYLYNNKDEDNVNSSDVRGQQFLDFGIHSNESTVRHDSHHTHQFKCNLQANIAILTNLRYILTIYFAVCMLILVCAWSWGVPCLWILLDPATICWLLLFLSGVTHALHVDKTHILQRRWLRASWSSQNSLYNYEFDTFSPMQTTLSQSQTINRRVSEDSLIQTPLIRVIYLSRHKFVNQWWFYNVYRKWLTYPDS